MRFAHLADIHLSYCQYGLKQRQQDIADVWLWACAKISQMNCDFVLLAGDLFHHRMVDPVSLSVACQGLKMMKCPIFAIKGNHEMFRTANEVDWLDFLESEGFLTLLDYEGLPMRIAGNDVDLYGLNWQGMATNQKVSELQIDSNVFTILVLHAGLEDMLAKNHPGTISWDILRPLTNHVNYVALGHVHKPLDGGWVFNPGSLETISANEWQWPDRGMIIVDVEGGTFSTHRLYPPRRDFIFLKEGEYNKMEPFWKEMVMILETSNPHEAEHIKARAEPLYLKVNLIKPDQSKVQTRTFSKAEMEIEAIEQLTHIDPVVVLQMKGLKDAQTIWSTVTPSENRGASNH